MSKDVTYDGWSWLANGWVLTSIDDMTPATRNNKLSQLANRNGSALVESQLGTKTITVEGYYRGDTIDDAQAMYDMLMIALNRQERPLIIPHAGATRTYTATPDSIVISEPGGLNNVTCSIQFTVATGYSESDSMTTLINSTVTTATSSPVFNIEASATCRPLIVLTFTSVTGGTGKTISIRNGKDLTGLTFERDFVSGDTISIDSDALQIYVNNVLTEPNGRMPTWEPGAGSLYYSDTFTDRSVNLLMTYNERNL